MAETRRLPDPAEPGSPHGVPRARRRFADRDLPVAVATGLLLAAAFLGTLFWHPAAFSALVAGLVVLGIWETARVFRERGVIVATPAVEAAAVVLLVGAYRAGPGGQGLGVLVLFVGAIVWELSDPERRDVLRNLAATVLLGLWVPFLGSYAILLVRRPGDAWLALLATIGVAVVSDIGAYFIGTRFGRTKLAPHVSPGKTWEGAAGGTAVAAGLAAAVLPLLGSSELFHPLSAVVFALPVAAAGVVGDLAESMLKRDLDVKDFGGLIPGHGGILDRVDGILFALPTGYYLLSVIA